MIVPLAAGGGGDVAARIVASEMGTILGQSIVVIATAPAGGTLDTAALLAECRARMPAYMVPGRIEVREGPLPRNPNGKIDRKTLASEVGD